MDRWTTLTVIFTVVFTVTATVILLLVGSMAPRVALAADVSFVNDVAPILVSRCESCHGPRRQEGDYEVTSYNLAMDQVTPGDPKRSPLYRLLIRKDEKRRMPKDKAALPQREIDTIKRWIESGSEFDGGDPEAHLRLNLPRPKYPTPPPRYRRPVPLTAVAFSHDGKTLATSGYHEIQLWDVDNETLIRRVSNLGERTYGLKFSPDGRFLAIACGTPGEYGESLLVDATSGRLIVQLAAMTDVALGVQFSPDGSRVAISGADGSIRIFAVHDGHNAVEQQRFDQHSDWVVDVAWSPDGTRLVSASRDKTSKTFEVKTGDIQSTYVGHHKPVYGVRFSKDGEFVYTSGADNHIHFWKSAPSLATAMSEKGDDPKVVHKIGGYSLPVYGLDLDGDMLFSFAADGRVQQHDTAKRALVRDYVGHRSRVYALDYHPESRRLATGSFDGEVRIWNVDDGKSLKRFIAAPGFPPSDPEEWRRASF